ncbi:MAG: M56 family metallopeptidase [Bacteroidetes bacterium]|nr:M56 family metallopeptidase [Bacteroidota bacterium]
MQQYLINTSAIWLLSLIIFDVCFRRESYHSYNRVYLLGTFLLGLFLPLYQWQDDSVSPITAINTSVEKIIITKQSITETITPETTSVQPSINWIFMVYILGLLISFVLFLKELITIIRLYKKGDKTKDGVWTVIETGKPHSPFSAFRYVFISDKKDYSADELQMILTHEELHGHALHFIDLMLMQAARIIFWFNPLIYIYANRLAIVHEYQADAMVDKSPKEYGSFLIEQAILKSAPALSHSFNRSPIKKRILMLTKNSTALSKSKMLIALPLVLVCLLCFTKNAFSDDTKKKVGNKVTYRGNVFEFKEWPVDTFTIVDPSTGEEKKVIRKREPSPIKMNGKEIYTDNYRDDGSYIAIPGLNTIGVLNASSLRQYLLDNLKDEVQQLSNDEYEIHLSNIIIDGKGKIVYYDYDGISFQEYANPKRAQKTIDSSVQVSFSKRIARLLNNVPSNTGAKLNGKPVPFMIHNTEFRNSIKVENGKIVSQ